MYRLQGVGEDSQGSEGSGFLWLRVWGVGLEGPGTTYVLARSRLGNHVEAQTEVEDEPKVTKAVALVFLEASKGEIWLCGCSPGKL